MLAPSFLPLLLLSWLLLVPKGPEGKGACLRKVIEVSLPGHRSQWKKMRSNLKGNQRIFSTSPFRFLNNFYPVDGTFKSAGSTSVICKCSPWGLGIMGNCLACAMEVL